MESINNDDVLSKYEDHVLIYNGGQRAVYRITHQEFGKVALKIGTYKSESDKGGWDLERIEREIDYLKEIDSEYYPKNYGFEKISGNRYVIFEEYIDSVPLNNCMERFQSPLEIMYLIQHLVLGLNVIWKKDIVHRDLKPPNILITKENLPKIIDLGIARDLKESSLTRIGFGGPCSEHYAAPELLHYSKKKIDRRTDQYNLGIILSQLLMKGTHPFEPSVVGGTSIRENIINDNWNREFFKNSIYEPIKPIASKLLGHNPHQRYRTPEMLLNDIEYCIGGYS